MGANCCSNQGKGQGNEDVNLDRPKPDVQVEQGVTTKGGQ